jgi:hypothetical protein
MQLSVSLVPSTITVKLSRGSWILIVRLQALSPSSLPDLDKLQCAEGLQFSFKNDRAGHCKNKDKHCNEGYLPCTILRMILALGVCADGSLVRFSKRRSRTSGKQVTSGHILQCFCY